MGISDVKKVTAELTKLPVVVLNSHTHDDHVGGNWEFASIYGMDTEFTRKNALGSREDAQAEITLDQICGALPKGFDSKTYVTRPWKITAYVHDGDRIDLGGRTLEVIATPGHTPDAISLIDRAERIALHRGYVLSGADLALSPGDGSERVCGVYSAVGGAGAAGQASARGAQHSGSLALGSSGIGGGFRSVRAGKIAPTPDSAGKVIYSVDGFSFLMRAP